LGSELEVVTERCEDGTSWTPIISTLTIRESACAFIMPIDEGELVSVFGTSSYKRHPYNLHVARLVHHAVRQHNSIYMCLHGGTSQMLKAYPAASGRMEGSSPYAAG
jgi:hypothetical protein